MGLLVRNEIVEKWLATAVFQFMDGWLELPDLLNSDRWIIGAPAYRFVKWIDFRIPTDFLGGDVYEWRLDTLEALGLMRPAARLVINFDLNREFFLGRVDLLSNFRRMLQKLWKYVSVLDIKRVEIDLWINLSQKEHFCTTLACGEDTVAGWVRELKLVSLSDCRSYNALTELV